MKTWAWADAEAQKGKRKRKRKRKRKGKKKRNNHTDNTDSKTKKKQQGRDNAFHLSFFPPAVAAMAAMADPNQAQDQLRLTPETGKTAGNKQQKASDDTEPDGRDMRKKERRGKKHPFPSTHPLTNKLRLHPSDPIPASAK